jgi:ribosomal protein S27AE
VTIREYIMRRMRWFPVVLVISIGGAVAIYHWVPQMSRLGRTIVCLPLVVGFIPYVQWAFGVRCPRCGKSFMSANGEFWYYTLTAETMECPKCGLDIDEPMDKPAG